MIPQNTFSSMRDVFEILDLAITRRSSTIPPKGLVELRTYLSQNLVELRLYQIKTPKQAESLWDGFREDDDTRDFIMNIGYDLDLWLSFSSDIGFITLAEKLATVYGRYHEDKNASVIDVDFLNRLPTEAELGKLYAGNPWLLTLMLLQIRGPGILELIPALPPPAPPSPPRKP